MQRINPNSPIRSGYKFEDLYVLKLCIDWLKAPENLKQILIQFVPDTVEVFGFALDDVVTIDKDNRYTFYQLKHKQNPEKDFWTFDHLFEKGLLKWIKSFDASKKLEQLGSFFITNGFPAKDVAKCHAKNKIRLTKIQTLYPNVYKKLTSAHSAALLKKFFKEFTFLFGNADKCNFESELRKILYNDLRVTKAGVDTLLLYITNLGSEKYPSPLTLKLIREQLAWDNPRPLNQNFEVPFDFEFFDKHTHQDLIDSLKNPEGGIKIIIGKPGTGKSTYLSKLYAILHDDLKIASARHHYHLNPKDGSFRDRLNTDRVREGLRAAFKKQDQEVLGNLSYENTEHIPLREFLNRIASYYHSKNSNFILIIDGLDHVLRESRDREELSQFLNEILYPQPGLWIIFGTQEMAVNYFPNVVYEYAPKDQWIEIKGFMRSAIHNIVLANLKDSDVPKHKEILEELVTEIFKKTSGNPLHLRYVLNQLKAIGNWIISYDLKKIKPYKNEIQEYYLDLWRHLPSLAKTMCFAISGLDFKLQEEQLFDLASYFSNSPSNISKAFNQIKHLIRTDLSGISVYHNSFLVFLTNQDEFSQQKILLYRKIKKWLSKGNNEDLQWSELPKIEYYLGNSDPLMSLNKGWVIENFLKCREEDKIERLLELAVEATFKNGDPKSLVNIKQLEVSFANREYNLSGVLKKIWVTSFSLKKDLHIPYPEYNKFNHYQIKELLIALKEKGIINKIPDEVVDRFNELLMERSYENEATIESWLEILAAFSGPTNRAFDFVKQFRNSKQSHNYFLKYLNTLLSQKKYQLVSNFLKNDFESNEKRELIPCMIYDDLRNNTTRWKSAISKLAPAGFTSNIATFYWSLINNSFPKQQKLSDQSLFLLKIEFHGSEAFKAYELYITNFYNCLYLFLTGKRKYVNSWITGADKRWPLQLMTTLLEVSRLLAVCIKEKTNFDIKRLIALFEDLRLLDFYEDYDIFELRRFVVPKCIVEIIELGTFINKRNGISNFLEIEDVRSINNSEWLYDSDKLSVWKMSSLSLSPEGFTFLKEEHIENLKSNLIPFRDRAEKYVDLAILARFLKMEVDAKHLLLKAAENIISYGNHKDILLYDIMRSIKICGDGGSQKVASYIRQISKYVYHIKELTDGDETGSFIYQLSELMAKFDKNLLYNLYFHATEKRIYYLSEHAFADILTTLDFSHPISFAIGNTSIDHNSYNTLSSLSKTDLSAKKVLNNIQNTFGKIDYSRGKEETTNYPNTKEKRDRTDYRSVPPNQLAAHLNNLSSQTVRRKRRGEHDYLMGWSQYWLKQNGDDLVDIVIHIKEIVTPNFQETGDDLLRLIYPYAYQVDQNFAFDCLIWAQANGSGWSEEYIRRMEESRKNWINVINDFPERVDEFYRKSIWNSGLYFGNENSAFVPIPKGTQFFIDAKRLGDAEKITEYHIQVLDELFPDVNLEVPDFISNEKRIEELEILIRRFEWLSPLVKERSGWHLSELLELDESGELHKKFKTWLSEINLESIACNGLLVLIKSLQNSNSNSYQHLNTDELGKLLIVRCRATDLLLMNIAEKLRQPLVIKTPFVISVTSEQPDITRENFYEKIGRHLPLIYQNYIDDLETATDLSVWSIWYYFYKQTCNKLKVKQTREDWNFRNSRGDYITGRATIFTEILRSTFFNLLDYLKEIWAIDFTEQFYLIIKTFQIDPSIWNINLQRKPSWWPSFKPIVKNVSLSKPELEINMQQLIFRNSKTQILHLNGSISSGISHYEGTIQGSIHALPFAYKILGSQLPSASAIYNKVLSNSGVWYPGIKDNHNFFFFDNELKCNQERSSFIYKDVELMPLISPISFSTHHMWQYYRLYHGARLLSPIISSPLNMNPKRNKIEYMKDNRTIAVFKDHVDGIRETAKFHGMIPAGNYIEIDKNYLQEFLHSNNMRLGYVIKTTYFTWKDRYSDEYSEADFFDTLNYSSIII